MQCIGSSISSQLVVLDVISWANGADKSIVTNLGLAGTVAAHLRDVDYSTADVLMWAFGAKKYAETTSCPTACISIGTRE